MFQRPKGGKRKKRPFYENSFKKIYEEEPIVKLATPESSIDPTKNQTNASTATADNREQMLNPLASFGVADMDEMIKSRFTHDPTNSINELKAEKKKLELVKLEHKQAVKEIDTFMNIVKMIIKSERAYGYALEGLGKSTVSVFGPADDGLFLKEIGENSKYEMKYLEEHDRGILKKRFDEEFLTQEFINLPEWKAFKSTINVVGAINKGCSKAIEKVTPKSISIVSHD